jgi:uncharacterized protein (DUF697 family)
MLTKRPKRMNPNQHKACHAIIHGASLSAAAAGLGLAQVPGSDNAVIIPIHIGMIVSLGRVFDVHVTDSLAKGVLLSVSAAEGARAISQFVVGWIPGLGNAINASTAAGLTEAIGWSVAHKFAKGEIVAD